MKPISSFTALIAAAQKLQAKKRKVFQALQANTYKAGGIHRNAARLI